MNLSTHKLTGFALASLAFSLHGICAQPKRVEPIAIPFQQGIPQSATRLMPMGAKSIFWGTFLDGKNKATKAVNLFAVNPKVQFANKSRGKEGVSGYHLTLDLFEQSGGYWKRFNRVPVGYQTNIWGPLLVSADFVWIDKARQMPLLSFRCFTKDGYWSGTPYGDALFLSFARGWKSRPTLQTAEYGFSNSSSNGYFYQNTGESNIRVVNNGGSMNIGQDANGNEIMALSYYRWSREKRKFVVVPESIPMIGDSMAMWRP